MSWIQPLIAGAIGAVIGTYGGAYFLQRRVEKKTEKIRNIAIRGLKIFKKYAKLPYQDTVNQFNQDLNVSEKRAILVALHKLGVPVKVSTKDVFDIKRVEFYDKKIDNDEIDDMIEQVNRGHCDNLFFMDVESSFTSNLRIKAIREIGKKFVENVLKECSLCMKEQKIQYPFEWEKNFTPGEIQTILVLISRVNNADYFKGDGTPDKEKMDILIKEIEIGLWDGYLFWDYESYQNMRSQNTLANLFQSMAINQATQQTSKNQQPIVSNNGTIHVEK